MGSGIKANEGSSLEVYDVKVNARSRLYLLKTIANHLKGVNSCFRERVFPENSSVKGLDLNKLLNNHTEFNKLLDDDVVRVCLLLALDFVFMGFELRHVIANEILGLADDLSAWNDFP
nr:phospholipase-like protein [Tanacetum cinerariifolium]